MRLNILGATKLDEAIDNVVRMILSELEENPDLRIDDVMLVVNTSSERDETSAMDGVYYACSDARTWFQVALLHHVAEHIES